MGFDGGIKMSSGLLMIINVKDTERRLFVSRPKGNKSGALSPCDMSPDDVDYEMSQGKDKRILEEKYCKKL